MTSIKLLLKSLLMEDSGQDLVEYALVAALVALGAVAAVNNVAGAITTTFSGVGTSLNTAAA